MASAARLLRRVPGAAILRRRTREMRWDEPGDAEAWEGRARRRRQAQVARWRRAQRRGGGAAPRREDEDHKGERGGTRTVGEDMKPRRSFPSPARGFARGEASHRATMSAAMRTPPPPPAIVDPPPLDRASLDALLPGSRYFNVAGSGPLMPIARRAMESYGRWLDSVAMFSHVGF